MTTNSSIHPPQRLLFGPGPTQVAPSVYAAMSQPIVSHMDPYFFQTSEAVQDMLRTVFGTKNPLTFAISGTGSGGMETAISSLVEPGTKVCVFANGFFCDRMTEMAKRNGGNVVRLEKPWGEVFTDAEAAEFIAHEKPQVVMYVQAETSTGAFQQGTGICKAAHDAGALVIADVVTSLGAMPVKVDETGIDIAYSCTQKGLSCVPGLSPITVSPRAAEYIEARKTPNRSWYFDLKLLNDYYKVSHRYHHTASATLFYALREALSLITQEGVENRWERHRRMHHAFVSGIEKLGLKMHVAPEHRIVNLNTPRVPEGVDDAKVRKLLMDEHGIEIMGGFGPLAGKVFRIGIMGPLATPEHVENFLKVFANALERSRTTAAVSN
ncbi:alanine-glyoxylate aminotransferase apoenzyme [Candidatus Koribacter versatilis Ellin345]|uniref:Alanine-glyoxylate aminotransferase apoenzyme n=2 Tax=Candidatus Korobacter versatilis TaxID=658062 RepID=Q1IVG8_KORVE|nr:alanine-glyoxylate aminotransferase apoenzyme [Candidatus Koribacter versatilis Ellin345]